jgi:hypothetical protein
MDRKGEIMAVTWDTIQGYFTQTDIDHMKQVTGGSLDLSSCQSVQQNAQEIYDMVSSGQMPPGSPWPTEWVQNFQEWMNEGSQCPPAKGGP